MAAVDERTGAIAVREERPLAEVSKGFTSFEDGDVLFAKITPCMENGKAALARSLTNGIGRGSTEFHVLRPGDRVLGEYIYHFVRRPQFRQEAKRNFTGTAGQQRVPKPFMENALVPLPPLAEQRRIVGILNRAARIKRLRARAAERLHEFIPALFVKMFGDPVENPMGWKIKPFTDLVEDATRYVKKIPKQEYRDHGKTAIVDQGKALIAGYTDIEEGNYQRSDPAIIFGDHTRYFKLVRFHFYLGADGTKLLIPKQTVIDPVFLYGHLKCLKIDAAGYSRHFKFLKEKSLMLPPLDNQLLFRTALDISEGIIAMAESASKTASGITSFLTNLLLENNT